MWFGSSEHGVPTMTEERKYPSQISITDPSLQITLDASPVGMIIFGHEGRVIYANTLAEQIFGKSVDALIGNRCGDFIACRHRHCDPRGCGNSEHCPTCPFYKAILAVLEGNTDLNVTKGEALVQHESDQPPIWLKFKASGIVLDGHKAVVVAMDDITDLKRSEKALQENEGRFRLMFMNAPMPYQSLDEQGNFLEVNQTFLDVLGYSREELIGRNFGDILHPDWVEHFKSNFPRFKAIGEILGVEFEMVKKDGSTILVFFNGKIQRDGQGRFQRTHCIFQDITDRRLAEEALRESEKKYRDIFETAPVGIFQNTPQGRFLSVNPEFARMAGYSSSSEMIEQVSDIAAQLYVRPEERIPYKELLQRHGKVRHHEIEFKRSDGSTFWASFNTKALKNRDGNIVYDGFVTDVTERVRAEQALRNAEALQRKMVANIGDVIVIIDQKGINRYKSPNIEKWFGWKPEEVIGADTLENIHPEDKDFAQQFLGSLLNEPNATNTAQCRYRCKDGSYKWIEFTGINLLHDPDIQGILGNYHDITERKQAEEALRESEQKYRFMTEQMNDVVWTSDLEMRVTYISPSDERVLGFTPEERMEHTLFDMLTPFSQEQAMEVISKEYAIEETGIADSRRVVSIELEYRHKDGSTRLLETLATGIRDDEGRLKGLHGVSRDITERKQAEDALRESEEKFRRIAENISDVVWIMGLDMRLSYVSPSVEKMVGESVAVHMNRSLEERLTPESIEKLYAVFTEEFEKENDPAVDKHRSREIEVEHYRADGSKFWISVNASFLRDENGNPTAIQGVTRDITDRKQAEAKYIKLQSQLIQAQKMESVGRLAGGVAHDFNNMLTIILGNTELAMENMALDDPLHNNLDEIFSAARRSADITRQLLAFARKQTIAPKVLDLNDTIESMLKMLRRLIGEDVDLAWQPGANIRQVRMDPSQIDQILANLCVNARDAIADVGKITIETGTATFDSAYCAEHPGFVAGDFVLIAVSDDGCGMDKETLANLFEPFFTTKDVDKGTGLGLATVYGIVKQNDGFINVYSEPDLGTTFKIYLPRHLSKTVSLPEQEPDKPSERGHETVLLVEDEPSILKMTRMMLEREGYKVLAAGTPGEAIRLANEHADEIHLLMTDVVMPEMNGRGLAKNILSLYPHLKCLFMSGYTANVIAHHGVLDEGVQFIQKPFAKQDLAIKVREVLDE